MKKYGGVYPAFYACLDGNGNVDPAVTRRYARYLADRGVDGLYVGGSSGECIYRSVGDRKTELRAVMEELGGEKRIIAHVACNSTRDSEDLASFAASLGVDAIAAIPPIYFRLPDRAIADYWNAISAAAPDTDFFIYNIPQLAGVGLSASLLGTMLRNPRVVGVKNSSLSCDDIIREKIAGGSGFTVFSGFDEQFVAGLAAGADGGIGGTYGVMPELYVRLFDLFGQGRIAEATALQTKLTRLIYSLTGCSGHMLAVCKEILRRDGFDLGLVSRPLPECADRDAEEIDLFIRGRDALLDEIRQTQ